MAIHMAGASCAEIRTGKLLLRPIRASDAAMIARHAADRRVAEATQNIPHPFPPGTAEEFVARAISGDRQGIVWVIDGTPGGMPDLLGIMSQKPVEVKRGQSGQSEIAFWVAPDYWNAGVASEALRALIDANPLRDSAYFAEVFQDNKATARLLSNAGFEYLGDAEAFSRARGEFLPTWTYICKLKR